MDEETVKRAIEPFFTTKGVGKGTGLGLSMVKGLAEQSGGQFNLHSIKGQGTRAELKLPIAEKESVATAAEQAEIEQGVSLRILAVDDDPLVLLNTVAMLEDLGHDVTEAANAKDAIVLLTARTFDVLVTDQAMPQMTGLQLAEMVQDRWPNIRTVIATGYAELSSEVSVPFVKLSKPFLQAELAKAIEDAPDTSGVTARILNFVRQQ